MLIALVVLGAAVVLLGDYLAARLAKRLRVSYGWYAPLSWALYLALGALAAQWVSLPATGAVGALVGFVDGAVGGLLAYRVGVIPWREAPTAAFLARSGLFTAAMCAVLTLLGGLGGIALALGRAV